MAKCQDDFSQNKIQALKSICSLLSGDAFFVQESTYPLATGGFIWLAGRSRMHDFILPISFER